jgi:hypothetical protein
VTLSGCQATLYGNQSTGGGTTTTTTASAVSGSATFSGGRVSFSTGQPVPPNAPGGTLKVSGSAAGVLVVGVVLADWFYYMVGPSQPKPLAPDARIADTCSCYKKPDPGYEIRDAR